MRQVAGRERPDSTLRGKQKARYYALEAKCATIGSFIHPDGPFAKARKDYFEHKKNPTLVVGRGQEAEINTFTSSFTAEEVDGEFFSLQKEYRKIQAEFNKLKAEVGHTPNPILLAPFAVESVSSSQYFKSSASEAFSPLRT